MNWDHHYACRYGPTVKGRWLGPIRWLLLCPSGPDGCDGCRSPIYVIWRVKKAPSLISRPMNGKQREISILLIYSIIKISINHKAHLTTNCHRTASSRISAYICSPSWQFFINTANHLCQHHSRHCHYLFVYWHYCLIFIRAFTSLYWFALLSLTH